MTRVAYRLAAKSAFHLGERGVGLEETSVSLRADTLFSALCLALRETGADLGGFLSAFPRASRGPGGGMVLKDGEPPLRISSAFPFSGSVYLFPRPMLPFKGVPAVDPGAAKQLKKIRFLSGQVFEALLAGDGLGDFLLPAASEQEQPRLLLYQDGGVWVSAREAGGLSGHTDLLSGNLKFWASGTQARVTVDRASSLSTLFAAGQVRFAPGCGLYFIADYRGPAWRKEIEKALYVLADSGIGGERSVGHGQFKLEIDESFELQQPAGAEHPGYTTLSPCWPAESEVSSGLLDGARYGLSNRRGWVTSPDAAGLRRQNVRMLAEGSVFKKKPEGALVDVNPLGAGGTPLVPHDVWRYGLGFPVRCSLEG